MLVTKKILKLAGIVLAMGFSLCFAQTPSYLSIPLPKDSQTPLAMSVAKLAHQLGYDGLVVGAGVGSRPNPITTSWDGLKQLMAYAAQNGMKVYLRLGQDAPALNSDGTPSWWAVTYNGGKPWPQPYRPPLAVAKAVAQIDWKTADGIARAAYVAAGKDPNQYLITEGADEADIGGADGPWIGRYSSVRTYYNNFKTEWSEWLSTGNPTYYSEAKSDYLKALPSSLWNNGPTPEGTIEPGFFTMLRAMMETYQPTNIYPLTLEGAHGSVGQTEINSVKGTDAAAISSLAAGRWAFNRYMTAPQTSAYNCEANWLSNENYQVSRMRQNPLMSGDFVCTEFGMQNLTSLIKGSFTIQQARQDILVGSRGESNIKGAGYFLGISTNALGDGFNLLNPDLTPVGGYVGPVEMTPF